MSFDYSLLAWLRRGYRRKKILDYLNKQESPKTPTEIKKALGIHLVKVSATLIELKGKSLVQVLNPKDHYGRLYVITQKGSVFCEKLSFA